MIKVYSALITDFTQADYTNQYSLLDRAIREKIAAKKDDIKRRQSLAGYILLYRALYELYPDRQPKIYFNSHGKPLCDFCFFNISHSEDRIVCVVSDTPVGIDIQKIRTIKRRSEYKFFNASENDYVNSDKNFVSMRYMEIFAKKEAAIKMLGESISYGSFVDVFSDEYNFTMQKNDDFIIIICVQNK